MAVVFFLETNLPEGEVNSIETTLNQSPLVLEVRYISSAQALKKFQERFPELQALVENLEINPFPPSLEATLQESSLSSREVLDFINQMREVPGVEDAQFNKEWVDRMHSFSRLAQAVGFFLGGILVLASFFIISNVIKLNVMARKEEIDILRLTGGTNMFIRIPFLLEGIFLGLWGGLLSLLILLIVIKLLPVYLGTSLGVLNDLINFRYLSFSQSLFLVTAGTIIGFLGSISSLSRFLKT